MLSNVSHPQDGGRKLICLRLLEGRFMNGATQETYNHLTGSLLSIKRTTHNVKGQQFDTWNMVLEDAPRNEKYDVSFGLESIAFRNIIAAIADNVERVDMSHLSITVWSSKGYNNARIFSNGERLRWPEKLGPTYDELEKKIREINMSLIDAGDGTEKS